MKGRRTAAHRRGTWQRSPAQRRRADAGFTLPELMIGIAVSGILLTAAVPAYFSIIQNARASGMATDITSAINLARAEAVKRSELVNLCPSTDGAACGGTWEQGWIVQVASDSEVLRVWGAVTGDSSIVQAPDDNQLLRFDALGALDTADTRFTVQVVGCDGERARDIDVGPTGRASVRKVACS